MKLYVSPAVPVSRLQQCTRLLSPTVWVQSYPEYCRKIYNLKSEQFEKAIEALEKTQGRVCPGLMLPISSHATANCTFHIYGARYVITTE